MSMMVEAKVMKRIAAAIAETVQEAGPQGAPEGILYAAVMGMIDLGAFQAIVGVLVEAGLCTRAGSHVLVTGPKMPPRKG